MTAYFLGIDVGGTKSHAIIADENGNALGLGVGGCGNHEAIGHEGTRNVLKSIIAEALAQAGLTIEQISGAGFGMAGYDWPCDHEPHLATINTLGLNAPFKVVNDSVIGLIAGASEGWGVGLVAGTGENCCGRDRQGREGRITGAGNWMGEYGGGGDIARKGLQAIGRQWTHRGPQTMLTEAYIQHFGARDVVDLLEGLARGRYRLTSAEARLVFQTAERGDAEAIAALRWAGHELGDLANGVIRQLDFEDEEFELVIGGTIFKHSQLIVDSMLQHVRTVAPKAKLVRLNAPPVVGGVLLGMECAEVDYPSVRPHLVESINAILAAYVPAASEG
jgi:N-acetylglucosamine kinase-like BadF-type ATPase